MHNQMPSGHQVTSCQPYLLGRWKEAPKPRAKSTVFSLVRLAHSPGSVQWAFFRLSLSLWPVLEINSPHLLLSDYFLENRWRVYLRDTIRGNLPTITYDKTMSCHIWALKTAHSRFQRSKTTPSESPVRTKTDLFVYRPRDLDSLVFEGDQPSYHQKWCTILQLWH